MAKNEFSWDSEKFIGTIDVHEKERRQVYLVSLEKEDEGEVFYISITTEKFFKNARKGQTTEHWNPVKNATFTMKVWQAVVELIEENIDIEDFM